MKKAAVDEKAAVQPPAQKEAETTQNATQMAVAFVDELEKRSLKQPININTTVKLDGRVVGQAAEQYLNRKYI